MEWLDTLSLLSSLICILSFTSTILLAITGFYILTSNALREIETLQEEWDCAGKEIYLLLKYWESEIQRGNEQFEQYLRSLQSSLDSLAETALYILRESMELKTVERGQGNRIVDVFGALDLRRRILWLCKRRDILEKMAEFSRRRQGLIHMQLSLLLTCVPPTPVFLV